MVELKYWFPDIELPVEASRRKGLSWAPLAPVLAYHTGLIEGKAPAYMCVMVLYGLPQRSGELLHATALPARITAAPAVLDESLFARPSPSLGGIPAFAHQGNTAASKEAVEKCIIALSPQVYGIEMSDGP